MPDQSAANVVAALKRETTYGVAATGGAGALIPPLLDSPGLKLDRGRIVSGRRRRNLIRDLGRLGGKNVTGTYNTELLPGGAIDLMFESVARGTFSAALTPSVSITTTTTTIVRAAGSWITDGFRSGDIITLSGDTTTANNNLRLRIETVTATVITTAGTPALTLNAVARSVTVTRLKKVINPAIPVNTSYSIEQYEADADFGELFLGCRVTGLAMQMRPNSPVTLAWSFQGNDRTIIDAAAAPYFTSPTELTGDSLIADDSWIRYKGSDIIKATGLDINFPISAAIEPTIGSVKSTDVFMNDMEPNGQITVIRDSVVALQDFDAETEFELMCLLRAPGADPKPCVGLYFPRVRVGGIDAPFLGGDASKKETRDLMIGVHAGDTDTDATAFAYYSSAA